MITVALQSGCSQAKIYDLAHFGATFDKNYIGKFGNEDTVARTSKIGERLATEMHDTAFSFVITATSVVKESNELIVYRGKYT